MRRPLRRQRRSVGGLTYDSPARPSARSSQQPTRRYPALIQLELDIKACLAASPAEIRSPAETIACAAPSWDIWYEISTGPASGERPTVATFGQSMQPQYLALLA
jgi:hypothetical protein